MNHLSQKFLSLILVIFLFAPLFLPLISFAQNPPKAIPVADTVTTGAPRAIPVVQYDTNTQGGTALGVNSSNPSAPNYQAGLAAKSGATSCIATGAVANVVKGKVTELLGSVVGSPTTVPTNPVSLTAKEVGFLGISWDQVGFCLVNSIIHYIGQSTVQWINTGFQGNPAFVQDPGQFFTDIADIQAGAFLNEITDGLACTPFQELIRINLASTYNAQNGPFIQQCSFSAISGNLEQFMSGETFGWQDFISYTQVPQNNPFGATYMAQVQLDNRIARALGTQNQLLAWGRGFLSATDPNTGKIISPGSVIEGQVNQRLFAGQNRLNIADEFDEIVDALVNQLITISLTKVLQPGT